LPAAVRANAVDRYSEKIMTVAQVPGSGFATLAGVHDGKRIDLWWKGAVPAPVKAQIGAARAAGLTVKTHPAVRSSEEFAAGVRRLESNSRLRSSGIKIESILGNEDVSAVDVTYSSLDRNDVTAGAAVKKMVEQLSGMPVRSVSRGRMLPLGAHYDSVPRISASYWPRRVGG